MKIRSIARAVLILASCSLIFGCEAKITSDDSGGGGNSGGLDISEESLKGVIAQQDWQYTTGHLIEDDDRLVIELFAEDVTLCERSWFRTETSVIVLTVTDLNGTYVGREPNMNVIARDTLGTITLLPYDVRVQLGGVQDGWLVGGLLATMSGGDLSVNGSFAVMDCRGEVVRRSL